MSQKVSTWTATLQHYSLDPVFQKACMCLTDQLKPRALQDKRSFCITLVQYSSRSKRAYDNRSSCKVQLKANKSEFSDSGGSKWTARHEQNDTTSQGQHWLSSFSFTSFSIIWKCPQEGKENKLNLKKKKRKEKEIGKMQKQRWKVSARSIQYVIVWEKALAWCSKLLIFH